MIKKLGEIATIIGGKNPRSDEYCDSGIPFLRVADINNGNIQYSSEGAKKTVYLPFECISSFSKQLVQEGDIILSKNFGQNKIALVKQENLPAIISSNLIIIRPFGVPEGYLYKYLSSKTGYETFCKQLKLIVRGVTIPHYTLKDLAELDVPIYDDDILDSLGNVEVLQHSERAELLDKIDNIILKESEIEHDVYNQLIEKGWDKEKLSMEEKFPLQHGSAMFDIAYTLPDTRRIYIEIKKSHANLNRQWLYRIQSFLEKDVDCFYVLAYSYYYEIHKPHLSAVLQLTEAPTIEELLKWESEVQDGQ